MSIEPKGELTQNSVAEKFSVTTADGKNYQTQKITSDFDREVKRLWEKGSDSHE